MRGSVEDRAGSTDRLMGLYGGTVIKREKDPDNDPECKDLNMMGRCKVEIPGEFDEGVWCQARGSGSYRFGRQESPPIGCDVLVQFVNGERDQGRWEYADATEDEIYPEYTHPDILVDGDLNFRFVRDRRDGEQYAAFQVIKDVGGAETLIAELRFDIENNMVRLFGITGLKLESGGLIDMDCTGDIQINGRKVMPVNRVL